MATKKEQHFVPKCYLRNFSDDVKKRQINLMVAKSGKLIEGAALRHQCARNYFYSKNTEIEDLLSHYESMFARCVREVSTGEIKDHHLYILREVAFLQYMRTEAVSKRMEASLKGMRQFVPPGTEFLNIPHECLLQFYINRPIFKDLRCVVVKNTTEIEFITSDDPAVLVNKYVHQKIEKYGGCGLKNAGVALVYPLTPKLLLLTFDNDIYNISRPSKNFINISDDKEVHRWNEIQFSNVNKVLYFNSWSFAKELEAKFSKFKTFDRPPRVQNYWGKKDEAKSNDSYSSIKIMNEGYSPSQEESVYFFSRENGVVPNDWPSALKYKLKPNFVDTKSAALIQRNGENKYHIV